MNDEIINEKNAAPLSPPEKNMEPPNPIATGSGVKKQEDHSKKLMIIMIVVFVIISIFGVFGVVGYIFYQKMNTTDLYTKDASMERVDEADSNDVNTIEGSVLRGTPGDGQYCKKLKDFVHATADDAVTDAEFEEGIEDFRGGEDFVGTREDVCLAILFSFDVYSMMPSSVSQDKSEEEQIKELLAAFVEKYDIEDSKSAEILLKNTYQSLNSARKRAQEASVKSNISSTVPAAILCMDDNGFLTEPEEGVNICRDDKDLSTWPAIGEMGGKWGGCEMGVTRKNGIMVGFTYCATLPSGDIARCTQTGCIFGVRE